MTDPGILKGLREIPQQFVEESCAYVRVYMRFGSLVLFSGYRIEGFFLMVFTSATLPKKD